MIATASIILACVIHIAFGARGNSEATPKLGPTFNIVADNGSDEAACKASGFTVRERKAKVFDCMIVWQEIDLLEIRLATLYDEVDYFVIVESPWSLAGQRERLWVQEAKPRLAKYWDKVIHIIAPDPIFSTLANLGLKSKAGERVDWKRNLLMRLGVRPFAKQGDIVIVGDVDEVPRKEAIHALKTCQLPRQGCFLTTMYAYGFDNVLSPGWPNPRWTEFGSQTDTELAELRYSTFNEATDPCMEDAGWHCSWCFPSLHDIVRKTRRYSHHDLYDEKEMNEKVVKDVLLPQGWRVEDYLVGKPSPHQMEVSTPRKLKAAEDVPPFWTIEGNADRLLYLKESKKAQHPEFIVEDALDSDWARHTD